MPKSIKLETIVKGGGEPYKKAFPRDLAEKVLKKSKNWKIQDGEPYVFKDGALIEKAKKKKED